MEHTTENTTGAGNTTAAQPIDAQYAIYCDHDYNTGPLVCYVHDIREARLIDAAPELLEACRYFEATLAGLSPAERDALPNDIMNISALASIAIAKATNGSGH
jgi:hypothetical protein